MASRWSLNHSKPIPESTLNFLSIMTYTYTLYLIFEFVLYMLHLLWMCNICCTFVLLDTYYTRFVPATFVTCYICYVCDILGSYLSVTFGVHDHQSLEFFKHRHELTTWLNPVNFQAFIISKPGPTPQTALFNNKMRLT